MADSNHSGDSRSATKFTRCRTGCLRCRKRRRKCDEKKPRCQNCIDKDFVCHYGLQVTFLPKNSITVPAGELHPPKLDSISVNNTKYNKIQFVNEDPLSIDAVIDASTDVPPSPTGSASTAVLSDPSSSPPVHRDPDRNTITGEHDDALEEENNSNENENSIYHDSPSILSQWQLADVAHPNQDEHVPPVTFNSPIDQSTTFSDKDEFAVRGLLALGTHPDANHASAISSNTAPYVEGFGPEVESPLAAISPPAQVVGSGNSEAQPDAISMLPHSPTTGLTHSLNSTPVITETQRLKLLQHYRYYVAPWLDICDLKHSYGIIALQMAVRSERLLSALMALSQACMRQSVGNLNTIELNNLSTQIEPPSDILGTHLSLDSTEAMLLKTLEELYLLVSDVSRAWTRMVTKSFREVDPMVPYAYGLNIDSSMYWMFLRLDLGAALANHTPIRMSLPKIPIPSLPLLCRTEDTHERVGHYAQVILWLCGKALIIYHQDTGPGQGHQFMDSWLQIFEELNQWHYLRPQEFQPMVELNAGDQALNPGSQFPMLLFTNGAGAFCNQLYHTAVLLLLECKPRTALVNSPQSPVLSPLWHAQRVCGIALNNDRRESWDPCLLASFLVAARHMTHESQQQEIIQGFSRIQAMTGWNIDKYLSQLREDWSFFEGVE